MDNFKDAPQTISELRSQKSELGKDWTPRDMLLSMLRSIDSGDLEIESCVVFLRYKDGHIGFRQACPDPLEAMGMAYSGSLVMNRAFTG